MVEFAGWEMSLSYKGIIEEHLAVRNSAGIFDISHMGRVKIEGDGALALIQKTTTNDASKLELHQGQYSIICNEGGGVIDDIFVYRLPIHYIIVVNAVNAERDLAWFKKQTRDINISFLENYGMLSVQGPKAEKILSKVLDAPLSTLKRNHTLGWKNIIISRTGYTGEDGFEFIVSNKEIEKLWNSIIEKGAQPCGLGARDTLRLEVGYPLYGHEYDEETTPLEAGYSWAVKFDKGDFIGKDALLKQKSEGLSKKLVGIKIEERAIPRAGNLIFDKNLKLVGKVTSGTFSPTLKKPIALAYLQSESAVLGNKVLIEIRDKKIPAKVVAKTFYKR